MRVAGVVLWTAPAVVTATVSKNGTGQGLSVSFAYGLSSSRVREVVRIWADGRLIRDEDGRQDVEFELRLHHGDEDQASDPLIASILGEDRAPAYRGIAYLVFEKFDLSSFGNRLPVITVELAGDGEPLTAESVCKDALGLPGAVSSHGQELEGFALAGDNNAEAISSLCEAFQPTFSYDGSEWSLRPASTHHLIGEGFWSVTGEAQAAFLIRSTADTPTKISLRFFDPEIAFAAGEKSARLPGAERLRRIELAAAMDGDRAKAAAATLLAKSHEDGRQLWLRLPLNYSNIQVGDHVSRNGETSDRFAVCEKHLKGGFLTLRIRREQAVMPPLPGETGGLTGASTLKRAPLATTLIELPGDIFDSEPKVGVLVSGGHSPFQSLPVSVMSAGFEQQISSSSVAASMGESLEVLAPASSEVVDRRNRLVVRFAHDPVLTGCDEQSLLGGANLLWINGEFVQFATATQIAPATYHLSELLRGRFDSEIELAHPTGSNVYLLDPAAVRVIKLPRDCIGSTVTARVYGPDACEAEATLRLSGRGIRPWRPTHLTVTDAPEGLQASWVRRCKEGGPWLDGVDTPLGASREGYTVTLNDQSGGSVQSHVAEPNVCFKREALEGLAPRPWRLEIRQLGDFAVGKPRIHIIN